MTAWYANSPAGARGPREQSALTVIESIVLGNGGPRHRATLKALVDGANLQLTDRHGKALALASSYGYTEMVKVAEKLARR